MYCSICPNATNKRPVEYRLKCSKTAELYQYTYLGTGFLLVIPGGISLLITSIVKIPVHIFSPVFMRTIQG